MGAFRWTNRAEERALYLHGQGFSTAKIALDLGAPNSRTVSMKLRHLRRGQVEPLMPKEALPVGEWRSFASRPLLVLALAEGLGISPDHSVVLAVLLEHVGEPLTSAQMQRFINAHRPPRLGAFHERIRAIREVLGRHAIGGFATMRERNAHGGEGCAPTTYALSVEGLDKCQAALRKVADSLALRPAGAPETGDGRVRGREAA